MRKNVTSVHRIDILTLRVDNFNANYFMREIAEVWREAGIQVNVVRGPMENPNADLVILHTDITTVPIEYLSAVRRYPAYLNGYVADISKRNISRNLVAGPDDTDGPVLAKTNLNAAGLQEAFIAAAGLMPGMNVPQEPYTIYPSAKDVPDEVWADPLIVVERFLPEMHDGFYCLRTWVFLGDKETNSLSYATEPIVKQRGVVKREVVDEVPSELRAMREELVFDYGKFDYAIVDGKVVLYDANRTPALGNFPREAYMPRVRHLAEGIWPYLGVTR
jgi:hypothetical protein